MSAPQTTAAAPTNFWAKLIAISAQRAAELEQHIKLLEEQCHLELKRNGWADSPLSVALSHAIGAMRVEAYIERKSVEKYQGWAQAEQERAATKNAAAEVAA